MVERKPFVEEFWTRCETTYCDGEGAESFADFIGRIKTMLDELKKADAKKIVVFTHGQLIRSLMWLMLTGKQEVGNVEMKQIYEFMNSIPYPNTAFIKLNFIENELFVSPISTEHLESELITY